MLAFPSLPVFESTHTMLDPMLSTEAMDLLQLMLLYLELIYPQPSLLFVPSMIQRINRRRCMLENTEVNGNLFGV
jgi:hypothetical protein